LAVYHPTPVGGPEEGGGELGNIRRSFVLVTVFCCCEKLEGCVENGGFEGFVAFSRAEAGKGEA
jgi:hypothetical protein